MKQNQKGFTLIELLAVIVILAIIALIATPIILNVVNDSRRKAAQDGAYGAIEAVKLAYTQAMTENQNFSGSGNIDFSDSDQKNWKIGGVTVKINGTTPTAGSININENGDISFTKTNGDTDNLKINSFTCSLGNNTEVTCE